MIFWNIFHIIIARGYRETLPARRCLQRAVRYIINNPYLFGNASDTTAVPWKLLFCNRDCSCRFLTWRLRRICGVEGSTPFRANGSSVGRVHNMMVRQSSLRFESAQENAFIPKSGTAVRTAAMQFGLLPAGRGYRSKELPQNNSNRTAGIILRQFLRRKGEQQPAEDISPVLPSPQDLTADHRITAGISGRGPALPPGLLPNRAALQPAFHPAMQMSDRAEGALHQQPCLRIRLKDEG